MSKKPHGIACPHCLSATRTVTSRGGVSPLYREVRLQCVNPECGATYGAELAITHIISPSAQPNPSITLRASAPRRHANDDAPAPANDTSGPEVPRPANDEHATSEAFG